ERLITAIPDQKLRAGLFQDAGQNLAGVAASQDQMPAMTGEAFVQTIQRMMQPPARRAAPGPLSRCFVIQDVKTDQWAAGSGRESQRGIIGQTQILAEPDEGGFHPLV